MHSIWQLLLLSNLRLFSGVEFIHTKQCASQRSDYYLRRAAEAVGFVCTRRLGAALDISPENETVLQRAMKVRCPKPGPPSGATSFQLGPIQSWGSSGLPSADCPVPKGARAEDIFPTPVGFIHASKLDFPDWKKTVRYIRDTSIKRFSKIAKKHRKASYHEQRDFFDDTQISDTRHALHEQEAWPEMYGSKEYRAWVSAAKNICVSFARKLGVPLSKEEAADMETNLWAAVYPEPRKGEVVAHHQHTHLEGLASFVFYVSMPEPVTPIIFTDPRGLPPVDINNEVLPDMNLDGEPPFHWPLEFYPGEGDIVIFPSYQVHKVPPHIGKGTRVVWPGNCYLPGRPTGNHLVNPVDGWLRFALTSWSAPKSFDSRDARPGAVKAYRAHAEAALTEAYYVHDDPKSKLWEVQNQLIAMLQSAPQDPDVWVDVGNLSAHMSVLNIVLNRRHRDFWADTTTFLVHALQLSPARAESVKKVIKKLSPNAGDSGELIAAYKEVRKELPGVIRHFRSLGDLEFIHFLHRDVNGPSKCQRTCPTKMPTPFKSMVTAGMFSSRVLVGQFGTGEDEEETILALARHVSGNASGSVQFGTRPPCWWRDQSATFAGIACDTSAHVWFADPRGAWPEFAGSKMWPPKCDAKLGTEPKAPFHKHTALDCSSGEFFLFPAWLAHQIAPQMKVRVRSFVVKMSLSTGVAAGWTIPSLHPHCAKLEEGDRHFRSEL